MGLSLSVEKKFSKFKKKFNRSYETPEEEQKRFEIFRKNYAKIQEHNKLYRAGEVTFMQGINQFADMEIEEVKAKYFGNYPKESPEEDANCE